MALTREPPYWALIFTSERTREDPAGYAQMADEMFALAFGAIGLSLGRDRGAEASV
jgi:hypothetical protein